MNNHAGARYCIHKCFIQLTLVIKGVKCKGRHKPASSDIAYW